MPVNCRKLLFFLGLIATHIIAIKSKQIPTRASIAAVGGTNLQDLQDFCRVSGKENICPAEIYMILSSRSRAGVYLQRFRIANKVLGDGFLEEWTVQLVACLTDINTTS